MGYELGVKIDPWGQGHGGSGGYSRARATTREQKLRALLECLESGHVDAARMAFTALINVDHHLTTHAVLSQVGAALQSANLALALQLGKTVSLEGFAMGAPPSNINANLGFSKSPFSAAKPLKTGHSKRPHTSGLGPGGEQRIDFSA